MKVELLFRISKGAKNSRFLVKVDDKDEDYKHILLPNSEDITEGMCFEIEDNPKKEWIERYKKPCKSIEKIKKHLAEYKYKKEPLGITENGEWNGKPYDYILPKDKILKNLIDNGYKKELEDRYHELEKKKEIHRGFAHLNSSQAFALNFFVPIIKENKFLELLDKKLEISETRFEHVLDDEEGTQIDFYLKDSNGGEYIFEVKYSEVKFGTANEDDEHIEKYNDTYKSILNKVLDEPDKLSMKKFFAEYQLWRNICYAREGKEVYFVFPKFREDLKKEVEAAKDKCNPGIKDKIHVLFVDDFVDKMPQSDNENLKEHYTEFKKKYLDLD